MDIKNFVIMCLHCLTCTHLKQFEHVVADVVIGQRLIQLLEICVIDVFEYQGWSSGLEEGKSR